jgi:hypothetical protein
VAVVELANLELWELVAQVVAEQELILAAELVAL